MLRRTHRLGGMGPVIGLGGGGRLWEKRASPQRRAWKVRPHDLLVFDIELVNLEVAPSKDPDTTPASLVKAGNGPAFLILVFPPQSLVEEAYYSTEANVAAPGPDPKAPNSPMSKASAEEIDDGLEEGGAVPIPARLAGWSRLAFIVPDEQLPIDWTIPGVLDAIGGLELSVAPNALPPRDPPPRIRPWLDALVHPHAIQVQAAALAAAAGGGAGALSGVADAPAFVTARAAGSTLLMARDRRTIRTIGYRLGLTEVSGSATAGFVDELTRDALTRRVVLARPVPQAPAATHTALELPWRLILSPNRHGAWFHAADPVESEATGHTELWHTRLGTRQPDGEPVDGPDPFRTVRAIWTTDADEPVTPPAGTDVWTPLQGTDDPFRASLDAFDRHNIVHLSSNFRLREVDPRYAYEPAPVDVDLLMLSSLGAWLDSRGVWEGETMPKGLAVEEWRHRATLGRDHYVRVVYAGRLYPTQHRASLIKVTERRFERSKAGNPAYLRQMFFIVPRERIRIYGDSKLAGEDDERWDLQLPFTAARITTVASPLLDDPENTMIQDEGCFVPYVKGQPFRFTFVASDARGREVDLAMPVVFIGQQHTDEPYATSIVPTKVATAYRERTWPGRAQLLAEVPVGGQSVAFARERRPDDTTYAVRSITFDAGIPKEAIYDDMPPREPRFVPIMRRAKLDVPSLQRIAKTTDAAEVVYPKTYLLDEFGGANAGEVFLAAEGDQLKVAFAEHADRSGGFVSPDMSLSGLSRVTGPVSGAINSAIGGSFNPGAWFGTLADEALLFGVLKLSDILEEVGFDEIDKLPRFIGETLDDVGRLIARLEELHRLLAANPVPQASAVIATLDQLTDPSTGTIPGLLSGGAPADVASDLAVLKGQLDGLATALPGAAGLGTGVREVIAQNVAALNDALDTFDSGLLAAFAAGDFLPEAFAARFEWRPVLKDWPSTKPIFHPAEPRGLVVLVEAVGDDLVVTAALDDFDIDLVVLVLKFNRILFRSRNGRKPEIDVDFEGFTFAGPLAFVETLRDLIPLDGFADPPEVTVTPEGITAGFSQGLPNIAVGVFSLENLSLAAGFSVPFIGKPMSTWFRFCERENPARLTVSMFGGGFFFGIVVDAEGLQVAEGAIEFGAAVSVNFGVASGSVSAMAGLYFKIEGETVTLAGYFRMRGEVEALGIVSVCIELYLEMLYESGSNKCVGTATISIEVEVALFSATVSITATKKFAGSGADPTLADVLDIKPDMTSDDWNAYCAAFAA